MIKKSILAVFIAWAFFSTSQAQLVNDLHTLYNPAYFTHYQNDSTSIFTPNGVNNTGKTNYNISFGTGYTSFGKGVGFTNSYISPTVAYAPNERLQVVVGATLSYNNFNNMAGNVGSIQNSSTPNSDNPTQVFAFSRYQLTSKLSVFASGSFCKNQLYTSPFYYGVGKMDYNEFGVGFNYKLGEKTTIGASFNFSNGSGYGFTPLNPYNQRFPF